MINKLEKELSQKYQCYVESLKNQHAADNSQFSALSRFKCETQIYVRVDIVNRFAMMLPE